MTFEPEKTIVLLARAQGGDDAAREELYRRIVPRLETFAHGRVPRSLRSFADTQDIVQETLVRSLDRLETFKPSHEGAFMHYLGKIIINRIRDLARRPRRESPMGEGFSPSSKQPSPVEEAVGAETFRAYQEALQTLKEDQKLAVFLHVEMNYSLAELAEALGRGTEASRKVLFRGLKNLAGKMRTGTGPETH